MTFGLTGNVELPVKGKCFSEDSIAYAALGQLPLCVAHRDMIHIHIQRPV